MMQVLRDIVARYAWLQCAMRPVILCCASLAVLPEGHAVESSASDSIAILAGAVRPASVEGASRHGFNLETLYGHRLASRWSLEVNLNASIFEVGRNQGNDFYQRALEVDGVFDLSGHRGMGLTPFLLAGIGVLNNDFYPDRRDGYGAVASAGLGVVSAPLFKNGLMLRVEARYVRDTREGGAIGAAPFRRNRNSPWACRARCRVQRSEDRGGARGSA